MAILVATAFLPRLVLALFFAVLQAGSGAQCSAQDVQSSRRAGDSGRPTPKSFDYVIIGGGTCGLVIASRLSENPEITVAVIEAGASVFNNPNVTQTAVYGTALNTDVDWQYVSQPQQYTDNRLQQYHAGKALGGTSVINGMTYIRPQAAQIDALEEVGNPGWNWASLLPYYKKAERFEHPTPAQLAGGAQFRQQYEGEAGPVNVSFNPLLPDKETYDLLRTTWAKFGYPVNPDTNSGSIRGFNVWPQTLDAVTAIRSDAARAYFWPVQAHRQNLHAFVNTTATRLVWADKQGSSSSSSSSEHGASGVTASGVQVIGANGQTHTIFASREVILSAGSLRSPVLLEQSGIGNPRILSKHGVDLVVDLPNVGENLQDQPNTNVYAQLAANASGYPTYATFSTASDLFGDNVTAVERHVYGDIPSYAAAIAGAANNATTQAIQERLLRLQAKLIFENETPVAEILSDPVANVRLIVFWTLLPFSRGNVHMTSNQAQPAINPNFFMQNWDGMVQVASARLARKVLETPPFYQAGETEVAPGFTTVPPNATDAQWLAYLKQTYSPNNHPIGTAAMMSRDLGGVVSPELVVYGTSNVRVIDASVLPYQVDGHLTSTLYAFAEKTADIIKSTWS